MNAGLELVQLHVLRSSADIILIDVYPLVSLFSDVVQGPYPWRENSSPSGEHILSTDKYCNIQFRCRLISKTNIESGWTRNIHVQTNDPPSRILVPLKSSIGRVDELLEPDNVVESGWSVMLLGVDKNA